MEGRVERLAVEQAGSIVLCSGDHARVKADFRPGEVEALQETRKSSQVSLRYVGQHVSSLAIAKGRTADVDYLPSRCPFACWGS